MEILPKFVKALHLQYLKMIKIHKRLTGVSHKPDKHLFKIYGLLDIIITIKLTIIPYNNTSCSFFLILNVALATVITRTVLHQCKII